MNLATGEIAFDWWAWFPIPVIFAACLGATAATMYLLKGKMRAAKSEATPETPLEVAVQLVCQWIISTSVSLLLSRGAAKLASIESIEILIAGTGLLAIIAVPILDKTYEDPFWFVRFLFSDRKPPKDD